MHTSERLAQHRLSYLKTQRDAEDGYEGPAEGRGDHVSYGSWQREMEGWQRAELSRESGRGRE